MSGPPVDLCRIRLCVPDSTYYDGENFAILFCSQCGRPVYRTKQEPEKEVTVEGFDIEN